MRLLPLFALIVSLGVAAPAASASDEPNSHEPVRVIFDTDMYSDIDDALALAMLHSLADRGEVDLLAITIGTDAPWIASYIDLVDTYYGRPDIPIGMVRPGKDVVTGAQLDQLDWYKGKPPYSPGFINYTQHLSQMEAPDGSLLYPHDLASSAQAEDAVALLRRTLAAQPDGSVVMIEVGYMTNFARLLASKPDGTSPLDGQALVARKVKLLSTMAGKFGPTMYQGKLSPADEPEFNVAQDVPAAQRVLAQWPTPIIASGFEIGWAMEFVGANIDSQLGYDPHHPIAETYRYTDPGYGGRENGTGPRHDHPTFDLTSVLYAARPDDGYFSLSQPGTIAALAEGRTGFTQSATGRHHFLLQDDAQKARTLEAMTMLVTQPPRALR